MKLGDVKSNSLWYLASVSISNSVHRRIYHSVDNSVHALVWHSVHDSVWYLKNSVRDSIYLSITEAKNETV